MICALAEALDVRLGRPRLQLRRAACLDHLEDAVERGPVVLGSGEELERARQGRVGGAAAPGGEGVQERRRRWGRGCNAAVGEGHGGRGRQAGRLKNDVRLAEHASLPGTVGANQVEDAGAQRPGSGVLHPHQSSQNCHAVARLRENRAPLEPVERGR